jgi:hypothetical protein
LARSPNKIKFESVKPRRLKTRLIMFETIAKHSMDFKGKPKKINSKL